MLPSTRIRISFGYSRDLSATLTTTLNLPIRISVDKIPDINLLSEWLADFDDVIWFNKLIAIALKRAVSPLSILWIRYYNYVFIVRDMCGIVGIHGVQDSFWIKNI